jgi:hypothetical protein
MNLWLEVDGHQVFTIEEATALHSRVLKKDVLFRS